MIFKILKSYYRTRKFKQVGKSNILEKGKFYHTKGLGIGEYCYIDSNDSISADGNIYTLNYNYETNLKSIYYDSCTINKKVTIDECCWIGGNVVITPVTNIGKGCIICAGETVRGNIPNYAIYVNRSVIKNRNNIDEFKKLYKNYKFYMKDKLRNIKIEYRLLRLFLAY